MIFTAILLGLALIVLLYLYATKLNRYWERKGVKYFFAVHDFKVQKNLFSVWDLLKELYDRFPDSRYSGFYHFNKPVLVLRDPELIKKICVKDFEHFLDHRQFIPDNSDPLWSKNLLSLKGQKWKDMRATLSPSFTGSKMRQMFVLMEECARNFTEYLVQNPEKTLEIELKDAFTRFTNDNIANTVFGIKCDSLRERENQFYINGKRATDFNGIWKVVKFFTSLLMPWVTKFIKISFFDESVSTFFKKIVGETLEYREKNHIERPDMINLLMNARKEIDENTENKPQKRKMDLDLDDITSQALLFFLGGFESVSIAMCFMALELAQNPDIQKRLIEELDEFRTNNKTFEYESFSKLPYLDMVFSETLRKWPPNLAMDRVCVKPYTIEPENPNEKPLTLECNDVIWLPFLTIHHDPKYWKNPEKFDPERFSPENKEKIIPYTYLPFGVGPRNCIGSRFAILEVKIVFFFLLEHFEIVPVKKSPIPFVRKRTSFSLASKNGFWFGLKKRAGI